MTTTRSEENESATPSSAATFDHSFQGWSVWIEPCEQQGRLLYVQVNDLCEQCGGKSTGLCPFVPHCTLLYNVSKEQIRKRVLEGGLHVNDNERVSLTDQQVGELLLKQCLDVFRREDTAGVGNNAAASDSQNLQLFPTQFYYFPYPKSADNGRGFGCVISMMLLEKSDWLVRLQKCASRVFPPDERHQNNSDDFIPHMAFVYAPEDRAEWLEQYTEDMSLTHKHLLSPFRARYLSLWSTEGKLNDWYRISRVEL